MKFTVDQIAAIVGGSVSGDGGLEISGFCQIESGKKGDISFIADEKYISCLASTGASAVIIDRSFEELINTDGKLTFIKVDNARLALAVLLQQYETLKRGKKVGVHASAVVSESAEISSNCWIAERSVVGANSKISSGTLVYPNVTIGENVSIGEGCIIYSGVVIYDDSVIGNHCTFQSGCIIGGDGFGFAPNSENEYQKVIHTGNVVIEDYVEIGANTTIDKGTIGSTIIRKGVKLDNLIQIAHNVEIGENTVMAAQCGVAGSAKIGKNCMIGGQVGIVGHLSIADEVKIAAQSGIGKSIVNKGAIVQGSPAFDIGQYKRSFVMFRKLPEFAQMISEIKREIKSLRKYSE